MVSPVPSTTRADVATSDVIQHAMAAALRTLRFLRQKSASATHHIDVLRDSARRHRERTASSLEARGGQGSETLETFQGGEAALPGPLQKEQRRDAGERLAQAERAHMEASRRDATTLLRSRERCATTQPPNVGVAVDA